MFPIITAQPIGGPRLRTEGRDPASGRSFARFAGLDGYTAIPAQDRLVARTLAQPARFQLGQSVPLETDLVQPALPFAKDVWVEMIDQATKTLDFGEFYAANKPGESLEPVIQAMERAAKRGVKIRFLCEKKFVRNDPEAYERLKRIPNLELQLFDISKVTGGILHAKYFVVDGEQCWVGSQNFDWRSLDHVLETGVRVRDARIAKQLLQVFDADWEMTRTDQLALPLGLPAAPPSDGDVELSASPARLNPPGIRSSIEVLLERIAGAKKSISLQTMLYSTGKHGEWRVLDDALRAAAARGVQVKLVVADWSTEEPAISQLKALAQVKNVEVRIASIPAWSRGCVPFARVTHSKYGVFDDETLWLSTSNLEHDYFYSSRNVDLTFKNRDLSQQALGIFQKLWTSRYVAPIDIGKVYAPPKRTCD